MPVGPLFRESLLQNDGQCFGRGRKLEQRLPAQHSGRSQVRQPIRQSTHSSRRCFYQQDVSLNVQDTRLEGFT